MQVPTADEQSPPPLAEGSVQSDAGGPLMSMMVISEQTNDDKYFSTTQVDKQD
jgi:hypothetical protein